MKDERKKYNILLVLTGGTICSFAGSDGKQSSDTKRAQALIIENFRKGDCKYKSSDIVEFHSEFPLDVLSENMPTTHWNTLIENFKTYDFSKYDGIIVLHGTDTLAYTASMLSILLCGTKIPVFLVSSQLAIYDKEANGNANFKSAVELIVNGTLPNIYAVYRNEEIVNGKVQKTMYVHYAAHLLQCANHSNNFYSCDMTPVSKDNAFFEGRACKQREMLLHTFKGINANVLKIQPYVGLDYRSFNVQNIDAIIHGTYHSSTLSTNPYKQAPTEIDYSRHSIFSLKRECDKKNPPVPIFIEPCDKESFAYSTTKLALDNGIKAINRLSSEMAYVKTLIGCSLGLTGDELHSYINTEINGEFIF